MEDKMLTESKNNYKWFGPSCIRINFFTANQFSRLFPFSCPFLTIRITPAIPVVGGILYIFTMCSLLRTSFSDPGIIPRASADEAAYIEKQIEVPNSLNSPTYRPPPRTKEIFVRGQTVKLKYCFTCKIFRPPRASHCSLCDNCVDRWEFVEISKSLPILNLCFFISDLIIIAVSSTIFFLASSTNWIFLCFSLGRQLCWSTQLQVLLHVHSIIIIFSCIYFRLCPNALGFTENRWRRLIPGHKEITTQRRSLFNLFLISLVCDWFGGLSYLSHNEWPNHQRGCEYCDKTYDRVWS